MFTVNEFTTGNCLNFVEYFQIDVRVATSHVFRVILDYVTFEIKIHSNGSETMHAAYSCVIQVLTSQQKTVDMPANFSIRTSDGSWNWLGEILASLSVNDTLTFTLASTDNITNQALNDGSNFTIRMSGSYLIHSRHTISTSSAKFDAKTHTNVNMSYTWNVCNLTLPVANVNYIVSENFFAGLGVASFYIIMWPGTKNNKFVSIYSHLAEAPVTITMPLRIRHTFELIDSNSVKPIVIDRHSMSDEYGMNQEWGTTEYFKYADLVKSIRHQCATIKYHVAYSV